MTAREEADKSLVEQEWEANPRAMYEAHRENWRAEVASLTAQLQAAQAAIEEMTEATDARHGSKSERLLNVAMIGSRADMSALAAVKAEALREAANEMSEILRFRTLGGPSDEWLRARAATIQQEGADRAAKATLMAGPCALCGNSLPNHRMLGHPFMVTPTENGEN